MGSNTRLCASITSTLNTAIKTPEKVNFKVTRRTSRQLKSFTMKTKASLRNDIETNTSILQVITPDRPGLLAQLANIFARFELTLYNAKISTLGERVEDTFYLRNNENQPLNDESVVEDLKQTIRQELDTRIRDDEDSSLFQSIKIGQ